MSAPVLIVADAAGATAIRAAIEGELGVTATDDIVRARAFASTGAFIVIFATPEFASDVPGALELDISARASQLAATIRTAIDQAIARQTSTARHDDVGALSYDEYIELARYAMTRRYLLALLGRHHGGVTDAARGANLKRESFHRLMRRCHVNADGFRE